MRARSAVILTLSLLLALVGSRMGSSSLLTSGLWLALLSLVRTLGMLALKRRGRSPGTLEKPPVTPIPACDRPNATNQQEEELDPARLRPYAPGDAPGLISWKQTARHGRLMVMDRAIASSPVRREGASTGTDVPSNREPGFLNLRAIRRHWHLYVTTLSGRGIDLLCLALLFVQAFAALRALVHPGSWLQAVTTMIALAASLAVLIPRPSSTRDMVVTAAAGSALIAMFALPLALLALLPAGEGATSLVALAGRTRDGALALYHAWPPLDANGDAAVALVLAGALVAQGLWLACLSGSTRSLAALMPLALLTMREVTRGPAPSWWELTLLVLPTAVLLLRGDPALIRHFAKSATSLRHKANARIALVTSIASIASLAMALVLASPLQAALQRSGICPQGVLLEGSVNPMADLSQALRAGGDDAQLVYQSSSGTSVYLRLDTISDLAGITWELDNGTDKASSFPWSTRELPPSATSASAPDAPQMSVRVSVRNLRCHFAPIIPGATSFAISGSASSDAWRWTPADSLWSQAGTTGSLAYTVAGSYLEPITKPEQIGELKALRDASDEAKGIPPNGELSPYLALPDDLPDSLRDAADEVLGLAESPANSSGGSSEDDIEMLRWLLNYFSHGFTYTLDAPLGTGNLSSLDAFMSERRGYCMHFAASTALMARELGIPSRIAIGYRPADVKDNSGAFVVPANSLHAWTELYLKGLGWVGLDATPATSTSRATTAAALGATHGQAEPKAKTADTRPATTPATPAQAAPRSDETASQAGAGAARQGRRAEFSWLGPSLLGALALAALCLPRLLRRSRTKRRLREIAAGGAPFEAAWNELLDLAMDAGLGPWRRLTEQQVVDDIVLRCSPSPRLIEGLRHLLRERCLAAYGPPDAGPVSGDARDELARFLREFASLTQPGHPIRRFARFLFPRSVAARMCT